MSQERQEGHRYHDSIRVNGKTFHYRASQEELHASVKEMNTIIRKVEDDDLRELTNKFQHMSPKMLKFVRSDVRQLKERIDAIKLHCGVNGEALAAAIFFEAPRKNASYLVRLEEKLKRIGEGFYDFILIVATTISELLSVGLDKFASVILWLIEVLKANEDKILPLVRTHLPNFAMALSQVGQVFPKEVHGNQALQASMSSLVINIIEQFCSSL